MRELLGAFKTMALHRGGKAQEFERRRVQAVRKATHLMSDGVQLPGELYQVGVSLFGVSGDRLSGAKHLDLQDRKGLPDVVVKLSCDPGTVRVLGIQYSPAQFIARQFGVMQLFFRNLEKSNVFGYQDQFSRCCSVIAAAPAKKPHQTRETLRLLSWRSSPPNSEVFVRRSSRPSAVSNSGCGSVG